MPPPLTVAALYRFVHLPDAAGMRVPLQARLRDAQLCGTLLLAEEGINGTIAGPDAALRSFIYQLQHDPLYAGAFADLDVKWSTAQTTPFRKARVRLKREIVTLGVPGVSPIDPQQTGQYVDPADWNALLEDPDLTVVDTRNDYEVQLGTFHTPAGPAVNPQTAAFGELPAFIDQELPPPSQGGKIAMFCTGGIRCEKSTAFLKSRGYRDVFHLRGGILRYLETVPEAQSKFRGACFVFDRRVAVTHGLKETDHELCFACGWPVSLAEQQHADYRPGVSCPRCVGRHSPQQVKRFTMRQRQAESRAQLPPAGSNRRARELCPATASGPPAPPPATS